MSEVGFKRLKVIVVGCGFMGREHSQRWFRIDETKLSAVVDVIPEKAKGLAELYGCESYESLGEALRREKPDIVDICTPTYTHKKLVLDALEASVNVICEKPLALTLEDGREIVNRASKTGVKFMVAHCLRFFLEYSRIKRLVDGGEVGEPRIARAYRLSGRPTWADWYLDQRLSGGVVVDLSIHDVDFLRWVFEDEVSRVYCQAVQPAGIRAQTHAQIMLKFKGGCLAFVEASWAMPEGFPFTTYFEIAGTEGIIIHDSRLSKSLTLHKSGSVEEYSPIAADGYFLELQHFARCVVEDREPMVTGEEALKSLKVCLAAVRSSLIGEPVSLSLKGGEV